MLIGTTSHHSLIALDIRIKSNTCHLNSFMDVGQCKTKKQKQHDNYTRLASKWEI